MQGHPPLLGFLCFLTSSWKGRGFKSVLQHSNTILPSLFQHSGSTLLRVRSGAIMVLPLGLLVSTKFSCSISQRSFKNSHISLMVACSGTQIVIFFTVSLDSPITMILTLSMLSPAGTLLLFQSKYTKDKNQFNIMWVVKTYFIFMLKRVQNNNKYQDDIPILHLSFACVVSLYRILSHFCLTSLRHSFSTTILPQSGTAHSQSQLSESMMAFLPGLVLYPQPVMSSGSQYDPYTRSHTDVIFPQLQFSPHGKWWILCEPAYRMPLKGIKLTLSWMLIAHRLVTMPWASTKSRGRGTKKQLVKTGTAWRKASMGWKANPEQGVTDCDLWCTEWSLWYRDEWCRMRWIQYVKNQSYTTWNSKYSGKQAVRFQSYWIFEQQGQVILRAVTKGVWPSILSSDHLMSNSFCSGYSRYCYFLGVNVLPPAQQKSTQEKVLMRKQKIMANTRVSRHEERYSSRRGMPVGWRSPQIWHGWLKCCRDCSTLSDWLLGIILVAQLIIF